MTKHKSEDAPWNLIDKHEDETDDHEVGPEGESQVLDRFGVILGFVHSVFDVEAPSTTEALEDTTQEEKVGAKVVVDHMEEYVSPVSAEWD